MEQEQKFSVTSEVAEVPSGPVQGAFHLLQRSEQGSCCINSENAEQAASAVANQEAGTLSWVSKWLE